MGGRKILRVIAGSVKGHKLKTPSGSSTRPTADRVKESLFNIIAADIFDKSILDLFAGTGNLGIESLSRGAAFAVFVDKSPECQAVITENLTHTKLGDKAKIILLDVKAAISIMSQEKRKFDIVFIDPPYSQGLIPETLKSLEASEIVAKDGLIIAESDFKDEIPETIGKFTKLKSKKYGDTIMSFFVYNE